jgi:hypothetical protein
MNFDIAPDPAEDAGGDAIASAPPPEVQDAIRVAAGAYSRLAESGRRLHFRRDESSGKVVVEVHCTDGNVISTVPASKVLDVAAGGSLD